MDLIPTHREWAVGVAGSPPSGRWRSDRGASTRDRPLPRPARQPLVERGRASSSDPAGAAESLARARRDLVLHVPQQELRNDPGPTVSVFRLDRVGPLPACAGGRRRRATRAPAGSRTNAPSCSAPASVSGVSFQSRAQWSPPFVQKYTSMPRTSEHGPAGRSPGLRGRAARLDAALRRGGERASCLTPKREREFAVLGVARGGEAGRRRVPRQRAPGVLRGPAARPRHPRPRVARRNRAGRGPRPEPATEVRRCRRRPSGPLSRPTRTGFRGDLPPVPH